MHLAVVLLRIRFEEEISLIRTYVLWVRQHNHIRDQALDMACLEDRIVFSMDNPHHLVVILMGEGDLNQDLIFGTLLNGQPE